MRREARGQAELVEQPQVGRLQAHRALEREDLVVGRERLDARRRVVDTCTRAAASMGEQAGRVGLDLDPPSRSRGRGRPARAARPVRGEERGQSYVRAQHPVRRQAMAAIDAPCRRGGSVGQAEAAASSGARRSSASGRHALAHGRTPPERGSRAGRRAPGGTGSSSSSGAPSTTIAGSARAGGGELRTGGAGWRGACLLIAVASASEVSSNCATASSTSMKRRGTGRAARGAHAALGRRRCAAGRRTGGTRRPARRTTGRRPGR